MQAKILMQIYGTEFYRIPFQMQRDEAKRRVGVFELCSTKRIPNPRPPPQKKISVRNFIAYLC
jgi:hypothetical protein